MKYFVYILVSKKNNSFYIGQTQNVEKRLKKHNMGYVPSTKTKTPWEVLFVEEVESRAKAMALEKELKSMKKRSSILKYIEEQKIK